MTIPDPGERVVPKGSEAVGAPIASKIRLYGASKALVIGINDYGEGLGGKSTWPKLSMAIKDAEAVAAALTDQGFKVTLKKDLSSAELETTLRDFFLVDGSDPEAQLLVWFGGHGHTIDGEGYLVPADAPDVRPTDVEFRRKALSMRRFGNFMREARAKHVLAVFDSCFAGTEFYVARAAPPTAITYATRLPVRQFVSSCEAAQEVADDGMFRRLFVDALRGQEPAADANGDGYITGTELGQFLFDKVTNLSNQRQTPRYGKLNALGFDRGDFVFGVHKLDPRPAPVPTPPMVSAVGEAALATQLPPARTPMHRWVAMGGEGRVRVGDDATGFATGTGHAAPVVSATLLGGGTRLVTSALDGSVRLTDVEASARLTAAGAPGVTGALYDRLWKPYGAPVAQGALWLAAQVLPLRVPETLKGQRGRVFRDCATCPEMVEIGTGSFLMGSPLSELERNNNERPRHLVSFKPFAVGRFAVTFDEWDACVTAGGCKLKPEDQGWGRGNRPVINVAWDEITGEYLPWLNKKTGQTYRLLSEPEWEYAARAGTTTAYSWGDAIGIGNSNCYSCGSVFDSRQTAPVGSFRPNAFGLYDMHGNVWQWTADCWHDSYTDAPTDGTTWTTACARHDNRVVRGGSYINDPSFLRSAARSRYADSSRDLILGFRIARTL